MFLVVFCFIFVGSFWRECWLKNGRCKQCASVHSKPLVTHREVGRGCDDGVPCWASEEYGVVAVRRREVIIGGRKRAARVKLAIT